MCSIVREFGGLRDTRNMKVEEMVTIFFNILGHDQKDRVIHKKFQWSIETVSRSFHKVLTSVLKLWGVLLKKPQLVPANHTDERWKWFKVRNNYWILDSLRSREQVII